MTNKDKIDTEIAKRKSIMAKINQPIIDKKKERLKRRKKLLKLWCEGGYISTISARALCPEIELQNELAELLLKKRGE